MLKKLDRVSFGARLKAANNRPTGFDYMRIILALLVFSSHTINVSYGTQFNSDFWRGWPRPLLACILPIFFALSGFLVAGSLDRCKTMVSFAGLRVVRIVPALAMETLLSAFILGLLFTSLPLGDYFSSPIFLKYFLNILGVIQFYLPGVFEGNAWPRTVNLQLWTLPYELYCYIAITVVAFVGVVRRPYMFIAFILALNIYLFVGLFYKTPFEHSPVLGPALVQSFLYGIAAYLYRDRIIWSGRLAAVCAVLAYLLLLRNDLEYLSPLPLAYITVYLGLLQPKKISLLDKGDYSYGIFLYGFPIQQGVAAIWPGYSWFFNLVVALPITLVFAVFSWHFVESPALRLKRPLIWLESKMLKIRDAIPGGNYLLPFTGLPKP